MQRVIPVLAVDADGPVPGELYGIANEIEEHLADFAAVDPDLVGNPFVDDPRESIAVGFWP